MNSELLKNKAFLDDLMYDPIGRTQTFFGKSPIRLDTSRGIDGYQLGAYLAPWGEVYGTPEDKGLMITGRGTGKTTIMQELNGADLASFLPYFLQVLHGEDKPVPIDMIFVANVKKNARKRLESVKRLIRQNAFLEKELIDYNSWTKEICELKNGAYMAAEGSSDNARGYHKRHKHGKVIYFLEEMAFWGGAQCMDSKDFVDNVADQSMGASIWGFTTPYGKRGGAWYYWNDPYWLKWWVPSWANPFQNRRKLARKVYRLKKMGRLLVIDQEIRGLFVDDAGLFFSNDVWLKAINPHLEWLYDVNASFDQIVEQVLKLGRRPGDYLLGIDPNKGIKTKGGDPIGINLTEKVGRKYINRFTVAFNGKTEDELLILFKLFFKNLNIRRVSFDAGGGYWKGLWTMFKNLNIRNMFLVDPQGTGVVEYMMNLRSAMSMGFYEMPESEDLKESQQAMKGFGDVDEGENEVMGNVKFQTDGKKSGIPCDLCAMGLSIEHEKLIQKSIDIKVEKPLDSSLTALQLTEDLSRISGGSKDNINPNILSVGVN